MQISATLRTNRANSSKPILRRAKIRRERELGRKVTYQDHPSISLKKSYPKSFKRKGSTVRNLYAANLKALKPHFQR